MLKKMINLIMIALTMIITQLSYYGLNYPLFLSELTYKGTRKLIKSAAFLIS